MAPRRLGMIVAAILVMWGALTLPLLTGQRTLYFRDVFHSHLPWKAFGAAELEAGRIPAFNPTWAMGQAFRGNPNTVSLYPGNLLYLVLPFWPAFNFHYALHWLLAAIAMFALARRGLGLSTAAAVLAGLAYGGSGFLMASLTFYNLLTVVAWWPLAMLGAMRGGRRGSALGALACGMALLGGEPVTALLGMVPLLALAIERRGARRGLMSALAVGLGGALVALPQLVATWRVVGFSFRGSHGVLASQASFYTFDLRRLLELVLPFPFGYPGHYGPDGLTTWGALDHLPYFFSIYPGIVALVIGAFAWRSSRALVGLAATGFVLASLLGLSGELLVSLGGGIFRSPEKLLLWPVLALPLLAARGLDLARAGVGSRALKAIVAGAVLAGIVAIAVRLLGFNPARLLGAVASDASVATAQREVWLAGLIVAAVILAATALALRWKNADTVVALQFAALLQLAPLWMTDEVAAYAAPPPVEVASPGDDVVVARMAYPAWEIGGERPEFPPGPHYPNERFEAMELSPAPGVLNGLRYPLAPDLEGLHHLFTSFLIIEIRDASWSARARWLEVVGADVLVAPEPLEAPSLVVSAINKSFGARSFFFRAVDPQPGAFWPDELVVAKSPLDAFARVAGSPSGTFPGVVPQPIEHRPGGRVEVLAMAPDRIELEVESEGGVAVLRRAFQPLLRASIEGREIPTVPINLAQLGVLVPAGKHHVVVSTSSGPEIAAAVVAGIAAVGLIAACVVPGSRSRRGRSRSPGSGAAVSSSAVLFLSMVVAIPLVGCSGEDTGAGSSSSVAERGDRGPATRPNVVLFLIDALRADRLGAYGYERPVSPRLDAFAADGVLFERAVAQASWTRPAMVSIFTGLLPQEHGTNGKLDRLAEGHVTLAEKLAEAGYENAAFVSNANMARRFGVAQGFAVYKQMRRAESRGEPLVAAALQWLDTRPDRSRPFFLYLHTVEPHAPYRPPPDLSEEFAPGPPPVDEVPDRGFMRKLGTGETAATTEIVEWMRALYDGEVAASDFAFAALVDGLTARGLYDDTLVVVTADHGEELYEHGGWEHGKTLYGEVLDVPLMMRLPGGPRGVRVRQPVQQIDVSPTVLDALSIEAAASDAGGAIAGRSLLPLLDDARETPRVDDATSSRAPSVFSLVDVEGTLWQSVRSGDWRFIRRPGPNGFIEELYRSSDDPAETRNLAASEPEIASRLRSELERAANLTPAAAATPEAVLLDRKLEKQLRALGYL